MSRYLKLSSEIRETELAEEAELRAAIEEVLAKRDETVARLNRVAETEVHLPAGKVQQLQRHKEVLADHRAAFGKIALKIQDARNRSNLLLNIRHDILAHKQRDVGRDNASNADDYILDERRRVDSANSFADRLLQLAYETRDELNAQRARLLNASLGMQSALLRVPGINVLILKINTRRKRDTLILGFVISLCIVFLFLFA